MQLPDHILGKGAVVALQERIKQPVLTIGSDKFTRAHLASINCFNFAAAAQLSNILTNHLKVQNVRDLFLNYSPRRLALPGLGVISLATLGAAFEQKLGKTLTDYIDHHRAENEKTVTFSTLKHNSPDSQGERRTKRDEKARKGRRSRQAHELRVQRHIERHPKTRNGNGQAAVTN
jgi:hypothetical protein